MIHREDILSIEYLEKTEYTGCCKGMRYRLEGVLADGERRLKTTIWPEPFNYAKTPEGQMISQVFEFSEDGVNAAIAWMNEELVSERYGI